jgi:hypothetical protein
MVVHLVGVHLFDNFESAGVHDVEGTVLGVVKLVEGNLCRKVFLGVAQKVFLGVANMMRRAAYWIAPLKTTKKRIGRNARSPLNFVLNPIKIFQRNLNEYIFVYIYIEMRDPYERLTTRPYFSVPV